MNYSYINKYIMGGNFHKEKGTGLNTGIQHNKSIRAYYSSFIK